MIVHWPAGMTRKGEIDPRPGHIIDVMPTLAEVAGASYPQRFRNRAILPPEGRSLLPALRSEPQQERTLCFEHEGNRAIREGAWKLVARAGQPWELYDIEADRTEQRNLAAQHPERVARMARLWDEWAERCYVSRQEKSSPGNQGETREK